VVGEPMIKSVIGSDANFPIQWTESSAKNASVIATGSNVLSPLIDKFESLLKVAAQNSESGSAGTGTVVTTGSLSNALSAISLAQSGVALENILYLSTGISSDKPMLLLYPNQSNGVINLLFFDILRKELVSYSNQYRYRLVNISPTALSQDLEFRKNQMKARNNYGCQPYAKYFTDNNFLDFSYYCLPDDGLFRFKVIHDWSGGIVREKSSFTTSQVVEELEKIRSQMFYSYLQNSVQIDLPVNYYFNSGLNKG